MYLPTGSLMSIEDPVFRDGTKMLGPCFKKKINNIGMCNRYRVRSDIGLNKLKLLNNIIRTMP
jgi:hypothetical protein